MTPNLGASPHRGASPRRTASPHHTASLHPTAAREIASPYRIALSATPDRKDAVA